MQSNKVRSILVIDDDRDDFDLVSEAIHQVDPEISVSFLDRCENSAKYKGQHFDLVLLDINMPAHDGFSWLKGIREHGSDIPVIMYTNSSNPAHILKAYNEGATLYFNKPESYKLLMKGIKKLLDLDWSDPFSIKEMHWQNGKYSTFQFA
jgi:CheY-like chemotaxis protein